MSDDVAALPPGVQPVQADASTNLHAAAFSRTRLYSTIANWQELHLDRASIQLPRIQTMSSSRGAAPPIAGPRFEELPEADDDILDHPPTRRAARAPRPASAPKRRTPKRPKPPPTPPPNPADLAECSNTLRTLLGYSGTVGAGYLVTVLLQRGLRSAT